jgi:hypothetical protein
MGLDIYTKKESHRSKLIEELLAFSEKISVSLRLDQGSIVKGNKNISVDKLKTAFGKLEVFNWVMERDSEQ